MEPAQQNEEQFQEHTQQQECPHGLLLRAIHEEFVHQGLSLCCDNDDSFCNNSGSDSNSVKDNSGGCKRVIAFTPSITGAFTPLRYTSGPNRLIEVRALAMFNDLIVNATATTKTTAPSRSKDREEGTGSFSAEADAAVCGVRGGSHDGVMRRSMTFDVERWLSKEEVSSMS